MTDPIDAQPELVERAVQNHRAAAKGIRRRLNRGWCVFKYYRKSQLARRGYRSTFGLIRKRIGRNHSPSTIDAATELPQRGQAEFGKLKDIRTTCVHRSKAEIREHLAQNEVCVLNQTKPLRWRISDDRTLLWQFQLHYHEFLLPLAASPTAQDIGLIEQTIESWLDENLIDDPASHLDAWHPYCISRRLPVWLNLLSGHESTGPQSSDQPRLSDELLGRMLASAHMQAEFLAANLEWDLRGNHLLENLRGLALAGAFFATPAADGWLDCVRRWLPDQIGEQILEHGEHFERCPMYHSQVLGNFLETILVCQTVAPDVARTLRPVAEKMFAFLIEIVHPDGEIPLLGDSCFGESPSVLCLEQLVEAAGIDIPSVVPSDPDITTIGPYWVFRDQNDMLIFDRGRVGAGTLPAHAHCDLLNFEATLGGQRWIVDSGNYNYLDDPMRWYCRSSLAHNVVTLDDQNQCDIWSKFRMGERGWPADLEHGREDGFCWATAAHNAYRRFDLSKISRLIGIAKHRFWYCLDRVEPGSNGSFYASTENNRLVGRVHLAPEVQIQQLDEYRFGLESGKTSCQLVIYGAGQIRLVEGWYCPEFGKRIRNQVLEFTFANTDRRLAGWLLLPRIASADDWPSTIDVNHEPSSDQITIANRDGEIHQFNWKHVT